MIKFIGKKNISKSRIQELLTFSEKTNTYTNNGPVKKLLEEKLEILLNLDSKKVVCCSNGTAALHSIMFLCEKKYNTKKWVTPAFTFPSAVVGTMFDVDILDIDSSTATLPMDADLLAPYDGIIITNLFGTYVDLVAWEKFCNKHHKILVFDNASSPLSNCDGINICNFGDFSFGSLHHTKYLGFGEGGFAVIDPEDYEILLQITTFGYNKQKKYNSASSNFKMSDVSAAYILSQIENYDLERHQQIQLGFAEALNDKKFEKAFNYKQGTVLGNFPIVGLKKIDNNILSHQTGVEIFKYYRPLKYLEHTEELYSKMINLPLYSTMKDEEVDIIITSIKECF